MSAESTGDLFRALADALEQAEEGYETSHASRMWAEECLRNAEAERDTERRRLSRMEGRLVATLARIDRVRELHTPEKRWQPHPDCEYSFDSAAEAADFAADSGVTEADCPHFTICTHCGQIERADAERQVHGEFGGYADALWPCPTIKALDGDA